MKLTIFYIPVGTASEASGIGELAVSNKLAACANVFPIQSIFPWNGQMNHENEICLILKTMPSHRHALHLFIQQNHPYAIPCIINWDVDVNEEYGTWVEQQLTGEVT